MTTLADAGPGSLRYGLVNRAPSPRPLTVVFGVGGTILLTNDLKIEQPFLTIDGSTAPAPGVTIHQTAFTNRFIVGGTHDVILRYLRIEGLFVDGGKDGGQNQMLVIDGDHAPDFTASRIVFDHLTSAKAGDSAADIWAKVSDVTVQWCLFYDNLQSQTISGYGAGAGTRQRLSIHHNVYAQSHERNPQLRADTRTVDLVNNIDYAWGVMTKSMPNSGYALRIRNEPGEPKVQGVNVVNNAFVPAGLRPGWGLVYGDKPGADPTDGGPPQVLPQGAVYLSSKMGAIWVLGNILPSANQDHYSTVAAPIPITHPVTTWPASSLGANVLPGVGTVYRTPYEQALIDKIAARLAQ